jgi:hypothetical protein
MALLQRLIRHPMIGFEYDQMGYAEFEYGATAKARDQLAGFMRNGTISAKRVAFKGTWGKSKSEFKAVVVGDKALLDTVGPGLSVQLEKSSMRAHDESILGWMTVGDHDQKIVIFRDDESYAKNVDRLQLFLESYLGDSADERVA